MSSTPRSVLVHNKLSSNYIYSCFSSLPSASCLKNSTHLTHLNDPETPSHSEAICLWKLFFHETSGAKKVRKYRSIWENKQQKERGKLSIIRVITLNTLIVQSTSAGKMQNSQFQYTVHKRHRLDTDTDPDAGRSWMQEKGTREDEMIIWLVSLTQRTQFEQAPRNGKGQGSLVC